ncbi:MAG: right-handed parallel beta-helix repeat-containing protein [Planctomycetota bacterium]|nr:right-handed parallel beta-helix repeat-containing protein [Planctomycetota bacterium]
MLFAPLICLLCSPGFSEVIKIDSPGVLDKPGTTYELTCDITVGRTAFMIKGDGITLDLGGHTVTYGTEVGVDRCSGVFLRMAGGEEAFKGVPREGFGGGNNFTLRNGRFVQGKQPLATKLNMRSGRILSAEGPVPGMSCFAVYIRGCRGVEITGITTDVNSRDTDNLYIRGCTDVLIHHNHCLSTVREITDRHWPGTGVITVADVLGPMEIHNNVVDGGGQWGIRVHGDGGHTGHLVQVHHNIVRHRTYTTNGYAIGAHAPNMRIYANVVRPVAGRGVHLTASGIDFFNNIVDVREKPNPEYPQTRAHGIKLEECRHTLVHHNFSRATAEKEYGEASPLDFSVGTHSANRVFKNTIVALRKPDAGPLWACTVNLYGTEADSLTLVHDNVFRTDHMHVRTDWGGARGAEFLRNRFEKSATADDYRFIYFWQSTAARTGDLVFRDSIPSSVADLKNAKVLYATTRRENVDVRVEWSVRVRVQDPAGKPVEGIQVRALSNGKEVSSSNTRDGSATLVLLDFRVVGDAASPIEEHGPYELTFSREDAVVHSMEVDPLRTSELTVILSNPRQKLYLYAGEDQRMQTGENALLDAIVKVVGSEEMPLIKWTQKQGPNQLSLAGPSSARVQVKLEKEGSYLFEVEARLGEVVLRDEVSIRADDALTPKAVAEASSEASVGTIVQLSGSKSVDPRRFPTEQVTYSWKQVEGPETMLSSPEWPDPIFSPVQAGKYVFELTFSNPIRTSEPARCIVRVK